MVYYYYLFSIRIFFFFFFFTQIRLFVDTNVYKILFLCVFISLNLMMQGFFSKRFELVALNGTYI